MVGVLISLVAAQGCAAVSYQDAKLIGKGKTEFTPTISRVGGSNDGESESLGNAYGATITTGVGEKVDLVAGYQRFEAKDNGGGINFAGLGPKFSLAKDKAALFVPASVMFGNGVDVMESLQIAPTALFSVPLGSKVTFNPGIKAVWSNCEDCDLLFGAQAGLSVPIGSKAVLRPEIGALKNPGESGTLWSFGLGISIR